MPEEDLNISFPQVVINHWITHRRSNQKHNFLQQTLDIVQTLPIMQTSFNVAFKSAELDRHIFLDTSLTGWLP